MQAVSSPAIQASVLALNRHYVAVHVISVRRAFCLLYKGLAEVISVEDGVFQTHDFDSWLELSLLKAGLGEIEEDSDWVNSVNFQIQAPRIVRLATYERLPRNSVKFNRRNIFLRDENRCQYCGRKLGTHKLSLDHVMPRSRGGPTSWENIVCCCLDCNVSKGGRTPQEAGMKLLTSPRKPTRSPLLMQQLQARKYSSWRTFVKED